MVVTLGQQYNIGEKLYSTLGMFLGGSKTLRILMLHIDGYKNKHGGFDVQHIHMSSRRHSRLDKTWVPRVSRGLLGADEHVLLLVRLRCSCQRY